MGMTRGVGAFYPKTVAESRECPPGPEFAFRMIRPGPLTRPGVGARSAPTSESRRTAHDGQCVGSGVVMRRVVVTGIGVAAPNGVGRAAFWNACKQGVSGIGPIRAFDASRHPIRVAGEVDEAQLASCLPDTAKKQFKVMSRAAKLGLGAAALALIDGHLDLAGEDPERVGVVVGTGIVPVDLGEIGPMLAARSTTTASSTPA